MSSRVSDDVTEVDIHNARTKAQHTLRKKIKAPQMFGTAQLLQFYSSIALIIIIFSGRASRRGFLVVRAQAQSPLRHLVQKLCDTTCHAHNSLRAFGLLELHDCKGKAIG